MTIKEFKERRKKNLMYFVGEINPKIEVFFKEHWLDKKTRKLYVVTMKLKIDKIEEMR